MNGWWRLPQPCYSQCDWGLIREHYTLLISPWSQGKLWVRVALSDSEEAEKCVDFSTMEGSYRVTKNKGFLLVPHLCINESAVFLVKGRCTTKSKCYYSWFILSILVILPWEKMGVAPNTCSVEQGQKMFHWLSQWFETSKLQLYLKEGAWGVSLTKESAVIMIEMFDLEKLHQFCSTL